MADVILIEFCYSRYKNIKQAI